MKDPARVLIVLLAAMSARPDAVAAQRSATEYQAPVARNATPTIAESGTIPRAPAPLSDAERISIVRSAELNVGGIDKHLRLTPRKPYAVDGHFHLLGSLYPESKMAEEGAIVLESIGGVAGVVATRFRALHAGRPILVDFTTQLSSSGKVPIQLFGSGITEDRTLSPGANHVTAIIVPEASGWYQLALILQATGDCYGCTRLHVYAVEITVLD